MIRTAKILVPTLAVVWVSMFIATHLPPAQLPDTQVSDKTAHYIAYAVLAILLHFVLRIRGMNWWRGAVLTLVVCAIYGAFDELTQPPVKRTADIMDWVANIKGAASGTAVALVICGLISLSQKKTDKPELASDA